MMEPFESHGTPNAVYSWSGNGPSSNNLHPKFYERINGRTKRVTLQRGYELVISGEFELTERLKFYFTKKKLM